MSVDTMSDAGLSFLEADCNFMLASLICDMHASGRPGMQGAAHDLYLASRRCH